MKLKEFKNSKEMLITKGTFDSDLLGAFNSSLNAYTRLKNNPKDEFEKNMAISDLSLAINSLMCAIIKLEKKIK